MFPTLLLALTVGLGAVPGTEDCPVRNTARTGTVTAALFDGRYVVESPTGRTYVQNRSGIALQAGDCIRLAGRSFVDHFHQTQFTMTNVDVVGSSPLAPPKPASVRDIVNECRDFENVVVTGFVADVFHDDADRRWHYLTLEDDGATVFVTVPTAGESGPSPTAFTRRTVSLTGTVIPHHCGARCFIGSHVEIAGPHAIRPLDSADARVSDFDLGRLASAPAVVRQGTCALEGTVRCAWGGRHMLLEGAKGMMHRIDLADGIVPADCGMRVRAIGLPETDLYHLNLCEARYETFADTAAVRPPAPEASVTAGRTPSISRLWRFHGKSCEFTGRVIAEASPIYGHRAMLESDGVRVTYDISAVPELTDRITLGARVRAVGCGLLETENWRPGAPPPRQTEIVIVARTPDDLTVLAHPPWWTPRRIAVVIGVLSALLIGLAAWNQLLQHMVRQRGRRLALGEIARAAADLRTEERTRLAVELHDALSQSLTGVACQLKAMDLVRRQDPGRIAACITLARRTVDSCRSELRNCLWDLRHRTLETADVQAAVRCTLEPHADDAELSVACDIPRESLTETALHDILCILRELVVNAIRHGHAGHVAVTGHLADDAMSLSVADDGCGFDPDARPGVEEGHFGLLGVEERVRRLYGTLRIVSAPGRGTTVEITLPKPS